MDPITAAILAVLPSLAADTVKASVKDSYEGLKAVIRHKWGDTAPISAAIAEVEDDPKSARRVIGLEEKVGAVKAADDADVMEALKTLVEQMKLHGVGREFAAGVHVNMNGGTQTGSIIGAGNISAGTINFGNL